MKSDIFEFADYKPYLKNWIQKQPRQGRGARTQMAKAAGCQAAYVSQVLNGGLHFSLEQAQEINGLVGHGTEEAHYFLLLVQWERAGTPTLKKHFHEQLEALREKRFVLKHRLGVAPHLGSEEQGIYYSSWIYAAVHVLVDIPEFRTKEAISKRLGLPLQRVADVLDFLVGTRLVVQEGTEYQMGKKSIHLGGDSPFITKHHTNWRMRAISSLDEGKDESLHYSSTITLSKEDLTEVKSHLIQSIKEVKARVRESKEETLLCFSLDLFEL